MENISKVLHFLGLVIVTLFLAVGLLYGMRGNIYISGALSLLPLIAFFFIVPFIQKKKTEEEGKAGEAIGLITYIIFALAAFVFFSHAINIEIFQKITTQKSAFDKLEAVQQLIKEYDKATDKKLNSFKDGVESELDRYFLTRAASQQALIEGRLGKGTINFYQGKEAIKKQAAEAIKGKQKAMRDKYALGDVLEQWETYQKRARPVFDYWNRLKLSYAYYDIDNMYKKIHGVAKSKMSDFDHLSFINVESVPLDNPVKGLTQASSVGIASITLAYLLSHLFVLLPYIIVKRPKKTGGRDKPSGNEKSYSGEVKI